jgi:protein-S-isoprenylcysteine O-methyltransferase Ste14
MKKKIIFTLCAVIILNILPLLFRPNLLLHFKTLTLITAAVILWMSQPSFVKKDMNADKQTDKLSVLFILIASSLSVFSSVIEWAYFNNNPSKFDFITVIGLAFLGAGICLRVWAIGILGKNFTATVKVTKEHELIKTGPYRYIRHPSYLGAFIAIAGCPIFLNNLITIFVSIIAMMIVYYYRIIFEEKALGDHFGKLYEEYKKHTYRLIPLIW